ncbi:MAG TPA: hypothetical protein VK849_15165 [Longimicrobiales bacterium]|nr:hypothetical protein [Longimicrobiales bacterium]
MPSDTMNGGGAKDLVGRALHALSPRIDAFHSAVATAEEEIRSYVTHRRGASEYRADQALVELGPFAVGRIDPERFASILIDADQLTHEAEVVLDRAEQILTAFAAETELHVVSVEPGGDLRDAVRAAFTQIGQVFGAARAVELARAGLFDPDKHNAFLSTLPFRKWNRAERQLAPPLVVELEADDLVAAGLGEFLDGLVKIVVVARGVTTPAPLARLVTPGTYVVQTADPDDLVALAESPHPGVGLLLEEERPELARFVHDPDAGETPWRRLSVGHLPDRPVVGRGRRPPRWLEELEHLEALAAAPAAAAAVEALGPETTGLVAAAPAAPVDQLAAWLLSQTDVDGA